MILSTICVPYLRSLLAHWVAEMLIATRNDPQHILQILKEILREIRKKVAVSFDQNAIILLA